MSNLGMCKLGMQSNALLMLHESAYLQLCNLHHAKCLSHKGFPGFPGAHHELAAAQTL